MGGGRSLRTVKSGQALTSFKGKKLKLRIILVAIGLSAMAIILLMPYRPFHDPLSTVLYDRHGKLLGARIAADGQWRFPPADSVPYKFEKCILLFEDKNFYRHFGVDPLALARAMYSNIREGKIVSGGSTISMQVIRLAGKNRSRTYAEKIREMWLAVRMELQYSKSDILNLYASNAPFGGNVVGLEAAAWRYFGRSPADLSWSEAAMLAVLPNAPALIHPGRNRQLLIEKRNHLLDRLLEHKLIDSTTCYLARLEQLPERPHALPRYAPHLLDRHFLSNRGSSLRSTLDQNLQKKVNGIVANHHKILQANQIHNLAVLVAEVESGNVLAYVGNTKATGAEDHGNQVDVITAPRSSGSILKPFLYAGMLDEGMILPNTLVPDIPTYMAGFSPKNFDLKYEGAVPASRALARSLNIPAVLMLKEFGVPRFHYLLEKMGMTTLRNSPGSYGLTLVLGGAEVTLWDLAAMYASMARTVNHFYENSGKYSPVDIHPLNYDLVKSSSGDEKMSKLTDHAPLSAGAIWLTYNALLEVNRPESEMGWESFSSSKKIAWKTGTSFGFRDAWAVGSRPGYVVAVWAGNADGEGRPGLTGINAAAPVLFDVFDLLPESGWFDRPYDELVEVPVCRQSGHRAGDICEPVDTVWVLRPGLRSSSCPYHQLVHLDSSEKYRVNSDCEQVSTMVTKPWFVLPAVQEWYYKMMKPSYKPLPTYRQDCLDLISQSIIEFIYPLKGRKVFIPVELDGKPGQLVFEIAHREPHTNVYWHLDDQYLGSTSNFHQMELRPSKGMHVVTVIDENGVEAAVQFEVVSD
ncbi:MAG: penicillin-binding protein 1C [Bacteroidales bacterium]|nr:penicillin-binding protein 1C [Bacteroidales bacterium]MCF8350926.1 penicillin-binding protein 1C [Bacteroidales bacterium]MCF8377405.1 penicillin-binding protein 1C [Bacteroidales bacterium]MCF8401440.1 penicillin-binding protein 1C [Bacteroidales bacterium]